MKSGFFQPGDVGDIGNDPRGDDHPVRLDIVAVNLQPVPPDEAGPPPDELDLWILLQAPLETRDDRTDDGILARPDPG